MYKSRCIYLNDDVGKRRALENLEFALTDPEPWFLSIAQRTAVDVKFSNWVVKDSYEEAKFCIKLASKEIMFYQLANEVDDNQASKILKFV